jgi:hypothetical protein
MAFTPTGHPDWQPVNSTPIPILVEAFTNLAPGTWGPVTVDVSSGGAYLLALQAAGGAEAAYTDITVVHQDLIGFPVHVDFFGGVPAGGTETNTGVIGSSVICRGNVYGSTLQISGQVAASAWITGVFGAGSPTAGDIDMNCYILPNGLTDPEPRMFCGVWTPLGDTGNAPGNLLYAANSVAIGPNASSGNQFIMPYSGPLDFEYYQQGVSTTPTNARIGLSAFAVATGAANLSNREFTTPAVVAGYDVSIDFPTCLQVINLINSDNAQTATWKVAMIAAASA